MGKLLPNHCCYCSIRTGATIIGCFSLAVSFPLMVILGMKSNDLRSSIPKTGHSGSVAHHYVTQFNIDIMESYYMAIYIYFLNAALNALEVLVTCGLFWGIYKKRESWVTRWLFVSVGWWMSHSVLALTLLLSSSTMEDLFIAAFVAPFLFFLGKTCLRTVAGLRAELLDEYDYYDSYPPSPRTTSAVTDNPTSGADTAATAVTISNVNVNDNVTL